MSTIVVKPLGSATGFTSEPFPAVEKLPVIRSAFASAATGDTDSVKRAQKPLVFAVPFSGVIAHAEEGDINSDSFQRPNDLIRRIWGRSASKNEFGDLEFVVKPSKAKIEGGESPAQYLLKIKLPGKTDDWKAIDPSASVTIKIGKQEAKLDAQTSREIVALHISFDPKMEDVDEGFTSFTAKVQKPQPFVLTFELPDFIAAEELVNNEVHTAKGLQVLDRKNGYLNISLPVRSEGQFKPASVPGLAGQQPS